MTNHTALFTNLLTSKEHTVKELAAATLLSESRVREILKTLPEVLTSGTKPARFWIPSPTLTLFRSSKWVKRAAETSETSETPETPETPETSDGCPFCKASASAITAAGEEGTFLGDSVGLCHECGEAFNRWSKEKVELPKSKGGKGKGRRLLNPQHKIDAKTKAVEAVGGTLEYRQEGRAWVMSLPNQAPVVMNSQEFARHTPETLVP
jgi:hypothetical protein